MRPSPPRSASLVHVPPNPPLPRGGAGGWGSTRRGGSGGLGVQPGPIAQQALVKQQAQVRQYWSNTGQTLTKGGANSTHARATHARAAEPPPRKSESPSTEI